MHHTTHQSRFGCYVVFSTAVACKCLGNVGNNVDATRACCSEARADFDGANCGGIGERLSNVAQCCKTYGTSSDCICPWGCDVLESEQQEKAEAESWSLCLRSYDMVNHNVSENSDGFPHMSCAEYGYYLLVTADITMDMDVRPSVSIWSTCSDKIAESQCIPSATRQ